MILINLKNVKFYKCVIPGKALNVHPCIYPLFLFYLEDPAYLPTISLPRSVANKQQIKLFYLKMLLLFKGVPNRLRLN